MPEEEWERVLQTNLFGVYNTVRAGMEQVIANSGQFVLVSSSYAFMNGVLSSPYATAKAGVEDGCMLIGGSCIIQPSGEMVALASSVGDELITSSCDLDLAKMGKEGNATGSHLHFERLNVRNGIGWSCSRIQNPAKSIAWKK